MTSDPSVLLPVPHGPGAHRALGRHHGTALCALGFALVGAALLVRAAPPALAPSQAYATVPLATQRTLTPSGALQGPVVRATAAVPPAPPAPVPGPLQEAVTAATEFLAAGAGAVGASAGALKGHVATGAVKAQALGPWGLGALGAAVALFSAVLLTRHCRRRAGAEARAEAEPRAEPLLEAADEPDGSTGIDPIGWVVESAQGLPDWIRERKVNEWRGVRRERPDYVPSPAPLSPAELASRFATGLATWFAERKRSKWRGVSRDAETGVSAAEKAPADEPIMGMENRAGDVWDDGDASGKIDFSRGGVRYIVY